MAHAAASAPGTVGEAEKNPRAFSPRSSWLHIRLTRPALRTASGLWLPETRAIKATEGKVLATGPGRLLPGGKRVPVWVGRREPTRSRTKQ